MSVISDLIKTLIEKSDFKTFLLSLAVSVLAKKLFALDWMWTIIVFCACYLVKYLLIWVKSKCVVIHTSCRERNDLRKRFCVIYASLPLSTKQALIELYNLPIQNFSNVRILNNFPEQQKIFQECNRVQDKLHLLTVERSIDSFIIKIDDVFCEVLAEHKSDFNKKL